MQYVFPNPKFHLQSKLNQHRLDILKNEQNQPAVIMVQYKTLQMTNIKTIIIIIGTLVRSCIRQLAQVSQSSVSRLGLSCCWCCQLGALVREKNSPKKHCGWFSGGWAETSLFAHLFGNHRPSFQNRQRQQPAIRCRQGRQVRLQAVGQTD